MEVIKRMLREFVNLIPGSVKKRLIAILRKVRGAQ